MSSACDADGDGIQNKLELKLFRTDPRKGDSDSDGLTDIEELCTTKTNPRDSDTDDDGIPDGDEFAPGPQPTPGDTCDQEGNTQGFEIPPPFIGNIFVGETEYNKVCLGCHPAAQGTKGAGQLFTALETRLSQAPMNLQLTTQELADLVAYLNSSNCNTGGPTPTPSGTPTPVPSGTPTPNPSPTATPTGKCTANGDTTEFGIPAGLTGNIDIGAQEFQATCFNCHRADRGVNFAFPALKAAVGGPPMNITSLSDQQFADLTAYLNRSGCSGDPTPTPTPLDPVSAGRLVFEQRCLVCHQRASEFRRLTPQKLAEAIAEKKQMNGISLTPEENSDLFAYFGSL